MKYIHLILKNLFRKKLRTVLTLGSFTVALFLFGLLATIETSLNQGVEIAGANRLVVRNRVSIIQPLPFAYKERIKQIPHVDEVSFLVWFGGYYQDRKNFFANMAVDTETIERVYPEIVLPAEQWTAFRQDRQGCLVGKDLAERFEWKLGDRVPLEGTIWAGTWEFNIRGIYVLEGLEAAAGDFYFHYHYLEEQRPFFKGTVGWYVVRIDDPAYAVEVAEGIDDRFRNSPYETKAESEKAFAAGFANQIGNIKLLMLSVGSIVFFTLLLVTGNTTAMAVRERFGELAVLKTVGFTDTGVLMLVITESLAIAAFGGGLGLVLVKLFTLGGDPTEGFLQLFYLAPSKMLAGFGLTLLVGLAAGLIPGLQAMRLRIVDALRRV